MNVYMLAFMQTPVLALGARVVDTNQIRGGGHMAIEQGSRVMAVDDIGTGMFSSVPRGTKGYVTDISGGYFVEARCSVQWDNGRMSDGVTGESIVEIRR